MSGEQRRLLVVEDNRETQLIIKAAFRNKYDVQVVDNISDASFQLSNYAFDAILLDLNLNGGENGKNLLIQMRSEKKTQHLPVIITTAYDLDTEDEKFFSNNANGFVQKPFNKKDLLMAVEKIFKTN